VGDAPDPLYFVGDCKKMIFNNTLAVVGSRAVTMYGEWVVNNIVKDVARYGVTIISGFMYGVDALSHRAALDVGGTTIAVMAGGVGTIFPKYQERLYYDIAEKGLVVSEFCDIQAQGKWTFARRNRIVAGLSYAVLIVEAAEASGSLITASYAKQYGRQILAIPGNLNSRNSYGTTQLLRDGAKMITCADDVLELYFGDSSNYRQGISSAVNKRLMLDEDEEPIGKDIPQKVFDLLYLEPLSSDEVAARLCIPVTDVLKVVTGLCIVGTVVDKDGKYYVN